MLTKEFFEKQDELIKKLHEVNEKPKSEIKIPEFKAKEKKKPNYNTYRTYHKKSQMQQHLDILKKINEGK